MNLQMFPFLYFPPLIYLDLFILVVDIDTGGLILLVRVNQAYGDFTGFTKGNIPKWICKKSWEAKNPVDKKNSVKQEMEEHIFYQTEREKKQMSKAQYEVKT